jgi:hypothetical protein
MEAKEAALEEGTVPNGEAGADEGAPEMTNATAVADVVIYYGGLISSNKKQAQQSSIKISSVRLLENISYIRQILIELVETCCLTNCSFARVGSKSAGLFIFWWHYTIAYIRFFSFTADEILNDFTELSTLVAEPVEGEPLTIELALVNDVYDVRKIRSVQYQQGCTEYF